MEDSATPKCKNNSKNHEQWKRNHVVTNPVLCGVGAGWINIFITFPINKFSFRQQVESTNPQKAWLNLKSYFSQNGSMRNIIYVYRGCSIPLVQKALANSIMYGVYSKARTNIGNNYNSISPIATCALACLTAGSFEALTCTPLERCQAVLQDRRHDTKFGGLKDVVKWHFTRRSRIAAFRSLYAGGLLIIFRNTVTTFNYFQIRDWYKQRYGDNVSGAEHVLFGCLSGAIGCTLSYPINTIKNKIQTNLTRQSVQQTFAQTWTKNSDTFHRGFYYGWRVAVFRSALSWGIQNSVYELLASHIF